MKNKHFYLLIAIPTAFFYWIFDSSLHYLLFGDLHFELFPDDIDELWMRCLILILLLAFGIFADHHTNKLIKKDREKFEVYLSMTNATQHILNNFLQSRMLFRGIAKENSTIDQEIFESYDQAIKTTIEQIDNLKNIQNPDKKTIEDKFLPK